MRTHFVIALLLLTSSLAGCTGDESYESNIESGDLTNSHAVYLMTNEGFPFLVETCISERLSEDRTVVAPFMLLEPLSGFTDEGKVDVDNVDSIPGTIVMYSWGEAEVSAIQEGSQTNNKDVEVRIQQAHGVGILYGFEFEDYPSCASLYHGTTDSEVRETVAGASADTLTIPRISVDPDSLQSILSQPVGTFTHAMFAPKNMTMTEIRELFEFEVTNTENNIPPATKVISRSSSNHPECENGPAQVTETLRDLNRDNIFDNTTGELTHLKIICTALSSDEVRSMSLTYLEDSSCASQRRTLAETPDGFFDLGCYVESQSEYYEAAEDVLRMSLCAEGTSPAQRAVLGPAATWEECLSYRISEALDAVAPRIDIAEIAAGTSSTCPNGGVRLTTWEDQDLNGNIALGEIVSREEICHGETGERGQDAEGWILSSERFDSSISCTGAGTYVLTGPDGDGDGTLSSSEVAERITVCDGATGAQGEGGADGTTSLVEMANTTMPGCAGQAIRIVAGLDLDSDGELDMAEYTSSRKVCVNSDLSSEQIWVTEELPANAVCPNGMQRVYVWEDLDGDETLDEDEVQRELIQCSTVSEPVTCDALDDADGDCLQDSSDSSDAENARALNSEEDDSDFDGVPDSEDEFPDCDDNAPDMNGDGIPDICE
jgi:hypothetical protein